MLLFCFVPTLHLLHTLHSNIWSNAVSFVFLLGRQKKYLLFVEEVQGDPLGREAVRQELREARLLHLHVLAHQVERDLGVELAEKLPARAAGDAELALQLLAVHCTRSKVPVTLRY